jgi:hypothetical protein
MEPFRFEFEGYACEMRANLDAKRFTFGVPAGMPADVERRLMAKLAEAVAPQGYELAERNGRRVFRPARW